MMQPNANAAAALTCKDRSNAVGWSAIYAPVKVALAMPATHE
jgi:hypothetical protein